MLSPGGKNQKGLEDERIVPSREKQNLVPINGSGENRGEQRKNLPATP